MPRTYQFPIGAGEAGLRLDHYLVRRLPVSLSRAMIQRGIREGAIRVDDRSVKAHYRLRAGDLVIAKFAALGARGGDATLRAQPIPLDIRYEDAHLLVVNKPAGLVTHPAPGHWDGTLVNAVLWHLREVRGSGFGVRGLGHEPPLPRAGIVHRLDKDTSGLLIVAKTEAAHAHLSKQLKARTLHRRYLAVTEGHLPLDAGTLNVPLGRHLTHRKEMAVRHLGGRAAVTHYRILKRFAAQSPAPYTAVELSLQTGRTHQIRVHLAHLGYPVMGDATYGKRPVSYWQALGVQRHLLHAYALDLRHPATQQSIHVTAPIPGDMMRWLDRETVERLTV